jgi:hypothetical protein
MVTNRDLYEEIQVLKKKQRHQVKSRWYYIFWGTATIAVVAGQLYVGTGYRMMSGAFHRILDTISVEVENDPMVIR